MDNKWKMKKINEFGFIWFFLLLQILILVSGTSSYFATIIGDKPEFWFQRSGSILVGLAVFTEIIIIHKSFTKEHFLVKDIELNNLLKSHLNYAVAMTALIGTIIWGYGDLIYLRFNS